MPSAGVAERGRLSQHGGRPLSDDDAARLRERLLVSRTIEELRRAHRDPAAKKLRKDELEKAIVAFLRTGEAALPTKRSLRKTGVKDVERDLNRKLRI